jgi:hypothetical protein
MIMLGHRALGITLTVYSSCWMDTGTVPSFFSYCDVSTYKEQYLRIMIDVYQHPQL